MIRVHIRLDGSEEVQVATVDLDDNPTPGEAKRRVAVALRAVADALEKCRLDR